MVQRTWSSRAAANSMASASAPRGFAAPDSSTWRMISAPGEPPGSRVKRTLKPNDSSVFASSPACVDLPVPSPPSKVMNLPRILFVASDRCGPNSDYGFISAAYAHSCTYEMKHNRAKHALYRLVRHGAHEIRAKNGRLTAYSRRP